MNDLKILYSYGLTRGTDHYEDNYEILLNIETLEEENYNSFDKNTFVLIGNLLYSGDYESPVPSLNEIRSMYFLLLREYDNDKFKVINDLFFKYDAIKYENNKYIFNNQLIRERLNNQSEVRIYDYFNEEKVLKRRNFK